MQYALIFYDLQLILLSWRKWGLPYPILRRLSRPRRAALRLAAGRCGRQPLGAGDAAVAAGEVGPPAGRAARKCRLFFLSSANSIRMFFKTDEPSFLFV
jgi:hypothetical protein